MKIRIEKSVTVITPTTCRQKLIDAVESVHNQTYKNITHLVVVDGVENMKECINLNIDRKFTNLKITSTPFNTGHSGLNGQRIYAAYPHLIDCDYIFFLDDDNWYDPVHVESLVETIEQNGLDFAFSLRKICDVNGNYLVDDNCESLGKWPIWMTHDNPQYLIDTSAYAFKHNFIRRTSHLWHTGAWGEDRRYLAYVRDHARFDTSGLYTLLYRLEGNERSVTEDFFRQGNTVQQQKYGKLPWQKIS